MFLLDRKLISQFNIERAQEFVEFWSSFYNYKVKEYLSTEYISYKNNLNLRNDLTIDNVKNLLRWKDPKYLTEIIMSGSNKGKKNIKVLSVLKKIEEINKFRNDKINYDEFKTIANAIFPNGIIWQIFLFHISKPDIYPIADQNIFRTYDLHTDTTLKISWKKYNNYVRYFFDIVKQCNFLTNDLDEYTTNLKRVDNALFVFGKFLKSYYNA